MQKLLPLGWLLLCLLTSCTQNLFRTASQPVYHKLSLDPSYQYRIRKDDKLTVSVWDHDELSVGSIYGLAPTVPTDGKWVLVDARGLVTLPRAGAFPVEGLTLAEAENNLKQVLGKWIVNPQVSIKVLNRQVTVLGEVHAPGPILLEKEHNTLMEVLGRAGDFRDFADKTHVKVVRTAPAASSSAVASADKVTPATAPGTVEETEIDMTAVDQADLSTLEVLPGDVVYVPARRGKEFNIRSGTAMAVASGASALFLLTRILLAL